MKILQMLKLKLLCKNDQLKVFVVPPQVKKHLILSQSNYNNKVAYKMGNLDLHL